MPLSHSARRTAGVKRKRPTGVDETWSQFPHQDITTTVAPRDFTHLEKPCVSTNAVARHFGDCSQHQLTRDQQPFSGWPATSYQIEPTRNHTSAHGGLHVFTVDNQTSSTTYNDSEFMWNDPFNFQCVDHQPCNNPECEDVQPCVANIDPCLDPQQCLGNICYDENCNDVGLACDEDCAGATRCATPCYRDGCGMPACEDSCPSTLPQSNVKDNITHKPAGEEVICQSSYCNIPGFQCIDPQCLSLDYAPAVHKHHDLDIFRKCGGRWDIHSSNCYGPSISHSASTGSHGQPFVESSCGTQAATASEHSLQQLLEFNNKFQPIHRHPEPSINTESAVPSLSHSLSATPTTTASRTLMRRDSFSPTPRLQPRESVCLWTEGKGPDARRCGIMFETAAELHAHVESAHIEGLPRDYSVAPSEGFYCRWLGCSRNASSNAPAAFAARPKLKRHLQTHTLHKPFICRICGISMKTKDAMDKHERTHSGERPYACSVPGCNKIFATSTELKTHMVVHSGRKPHECPICGEGFADSSNLSKHKKTHFVGMYRCPNDSCGARMKRWDQMRRHIISQGHGQWLLHDADAQKEYKMRMEREWKKLPDDEKLIAGADLES